MSKAKEMLKIAGFADTPEGRAAFYKKFPNQKSWEKRYGNGGNVYADGGPTGDGYIGVQFTDRGLDPEHMKNLGTLGNTTGFNRGLTDLEFSNAASRRSGVYGGISLNRPNTLFGTGAVGISETISRGPDPSYSSPQGYKMLDWKSGTSPYAEVGLKYAPGTILNPNYRRGLSFAGTSLGTGLSYDNNSLSPYVDFNPELSYNFGNKLLGTKSKKNQPFSAYAGMDVRVRPFKGEDLYDVGGGQRIARDSGINERASGAQRANFYAGLEGRTRDGLAISGRVSTDPGLQSTFDGKPMYTIGVSKKFEAGGPTTPMVGPEMYARGGYTYPLPTGDIFDMMGLSQINQYMHGGGIQSYGEGSGIHIDPSKRGTFTAAATKHGKSVQEFARQVLGNKDNYSPAMVKKANFARNAAKWKREDGGTVGDIQDVISTANRYDNWLNPTDRPIYAQGGQIDDMITTANRYDNWMNVPKYGLGDIIPGVGDVILGTLDTTLAGLGGQDIIGDKQYSDTGFGRTMKDVSHYGSAVTESLLPTVVSYIPGVGQGLSTAINAFQMGVDALTPDDMERLQSESGRNAMYLGMGLDAAGAITSLGTGAGKAASTGTKLAKAAKVANTVNKIATGVKTASDIYNVASDPNASGADWLGAAAGALGTAGSSVGGDMGDTLQTIGKFGKLGKSAITTGQALSSGRLDAGQTAASLAGLAGNALETASSFTGEKGTRALSDINRGLNTAGILASMYSAGRQSNIPGAAAMLSAASRNYMDYKRAAQERQASFPSMSPAPTPEQLGEFYTPTEYMRNGGYLSGNVRKFANGGTTEINVEGNELLVDPSNPGGGGVPRVLANYQNIPAHPEDGSLDPGGNVSAKVGAFVIPKRMKTKYETAVKTNDKLYSDALMNNIHRRKQQKEMEEATQQMYAEQEMTNGTPSPFDMFVAQYGGVVPMYAMGGSVPMYAEGDEVTYAPKDLKRRNYKKYWLNNVLVEDKETGEKKVIPFNEYDANEEKYNNLEGRGPSSIYGKDFNFADKEGLYFRSSWRRYKKAADEEKAKANPKEAKRRDGLTKEQFDEIYREAYEEKGVKNWKRDSRKAWRNAGKPEEQPEQKGWEKDKSGRYTRKGYKDKFMSTYDPEGQGISRKEFREAWRDYKEKFKDQKKLGAKPEDKKSGAVDPNAPGAGMFDRSGFEKALPYIGSLAGLAYAAFDKPFRMNAEDYMVKDRVKAYEDEYVPDYDLYNTAMYQMRKMAGGSPAYLASAQGLYNRFGKISAEERRKVREANQARKMAADVENLKIDAENKKIAMTVADYNEKNRSERSNAILESLFGERGLTGVAMTDRSNRMVEQGLMARYPEFFGLQPWNPKDEDEKKEGK